MPGANCTRIAGWIDPTPRATPYRVGPGFTLYRGGRIDWGGAPARARPVGKYERVLTMKLYERYRPVSLSQVVGQPKAVALAQRIIDRGTGGESLWLAGNTGTGKTTLARIIARAHCGGEQGITELDAADDLSVAELEEIDKALSFRPLWGNLEKRAWIINEAHGLKASALRRLLGIMERAARDPNGTVCILFTTTRAGQDELFGDSSDAGALLSRCTKLPLTNQGLAESFAQRALEIARGEGLDGQPIGEYVKLAKRENNNFRGMLQRIEEGCMIAGGAA